VEVFDIPRRQFELSMITLELEFVKSKGPGAVQEQVDALELIKQLQRRFASQVFTEDQKVTFEYVGNNYLFTVTGVMVEGQDDKQTVRRGRVPPRLPRRPPLTSSQHPGRQDRLRLPGAQRRGHQGDQPAEQRGA